MKKLLVNGRANCQSREGDASTVASYNDQQPPKKSKISSDAVEKIIDATIPVMGGCSVWLSLNNMTLTDEDRRIIAAGEELNDKHIDFAQMLIKKHFENIKGLASTILFSSKKCQPLISGGALQIVHTRGNHWIVASTIECKNEVLIFDSLYLDVDERTKELITEMLGMGLDIRMEKAPKQKGVKDCGVFAIAVCTSFAYKCGCFTFKQSVMRDHLIHCYENVCLVPFPA